MSDDSGVLGNLPRSRPGQRSDKRRAGTRTPAAAGPRPRKATAQSAAAKQRSRSGASPRTARPKGAPRAAKQSRPAPTQAPRAASDPITEAVRVAAKLTEFGVGVAGGILRRLPGR